MRKYDLVVDARMINSSGIGMYLKNVLPAVVKEFDTVLLGNAQELSVFHWAKGSRIIEFTAPIYSIKEQFLYPFVVPRTTVLWCPHFNAPLFPVSTKHILTTIHDVNHLANKGHMSILKRYYARILYSSALKRSKRIITVSHFSKSEIMRYLKADEKKIIPVYNGVDHENFARIRDSVLENVPDKYILFVGNVKPHKNLIVLLKAYLELPNSLKETYKLVILGKKKGFITPDQGIIKFIEENDLMKHLFFTGYIKDNQVPPLYRNASLFVFPSFYEGFGLPLLEAMVCGVPVISSNATSLPEVGGDAVLYFDPRDQQALAHKIMLFLLNEDLRANFMERGEKRVEDFSWAVAQNEHLRIIRELANIRMVHE